MITEPRKISRRRPFPTDPDFEGSQAGTPAPLEPAAPFQVRAVEEPGGPQAGTPAPPEAPAQEFQVRTAGTVTLPPPHWAKYQATPPPRQEE
jgi:hypothetical protein